jgi:hypothetical protein
MKKITFVLALMMVSTFAFADATSGSVSGAVAQQSVTGGANDNQNMNGLYQDQSSHNSGNTYAPAADLSRAVGMATAPALTTTLTETCMGSTSVGGGFSGGSFSFGTTWRDSACVRRLDAREIRTFGDVQAAKEIMCDSDQVREAFKRVGRPCAADGGIYTVSAPVAEVAAPVAAPVAVVAPAVGTDKKVGDDADELAKRTQQILNQAEESAASLRAKGF